MGKIDQPWGHQKSGSAWLAVQSDCAEALGPAGRIHCTIDDWANGKVLSHNGSNGIWYTTVIVAPNLNRAFVVSTNSRDFGITKMPNASYSNRQTV